MKQALRACEPTSPDKIYQERTYIFVMNDPFEFAESLNKETIAYAEDQTEKFRKKYGDIPNEVRNLVEDFYNARRVVEVKMSNDHILNLYVENKQYNLSLDGDKFYSTNNVIAWINCDEGCNRIAFFETPGSDAGTLKIMAGKRIEEEIYGRINSILFTDDSYYLVKTFSDEAPPDGGELHSHRVLQDGKIVFGAGLKSDDFITLHRFGNKIAIDVGDWKKSETYAGELNDPSTWKRVRESDCPAKTLKILGDDIYCLEIKEKGLIKRNADILLESEQPIEDCVSVKDGFLVFHLDDAKTLPTLYDLSGNRKKTFPLKESMGLGSADSDGRNAAIVFHSFGIPFSLYIYDNGKLEKIEERRTLDVQVKEDWVESTGTKVHYFFISLNGDQKKVLAYGYGGFNISLTPMFYPLMAALLKLGVAVAYTNLRGGGEYGENWHKSGMRENKQNVFDDFISVIESLKKQGSDIVAFGASNGGLLVSSTVTQRPDLLKGAVIGNPVIDMMRFHLMSVGKFWISEYGDPDIEEDARYLIKYSPYHNIRDLKYPKILIYSRLNDDRVHPAHAIKFHMKMSKVNPDTYLRINNGGGHMGIAPAEMVSETSDIAEFVLNCLNAED